MGNQSIQEIKIVNSDLDTIFTENKKSNNRRTNKQSFVEKIVQTENNCLNTARVSSSIISTLHNEFNERKQFKKIKIINNAVQPGEEGEKFEIIKKNNSDLKDEQLIDDCLLKHFFLQSFNKQARKEIIKQMSLVKVKANNYVFKEGTTGNFFYIVKSGTSQLIIAEKNIKEFTMGNSFGELALLHNAPRSGSVIALTDCLFWVLERKIFRAIINEITETHYEENKQFLESLPLLSTLQNFQKIILSNALCKESFKKNEFIVRRGEQSECVFIIKKGEVMCIDEDRQIIKELRTGENFGERSILLGSKRTMDVVAKTDCVCYSISIHTLSTMLSQNYRSCLLLSFMDKAFSNSKYFNKLSVKDLEHVFRFFQANNLGKDNVAFPKGHIKSSKIVIIIDGNLINVIYFFDLFSLKIKKSLQEGETFFLKKNCFAYQKKKLIMSFCHIQMFSFWKLIHLQY